MKHADADALSRLDDLVGKLRALDGLKEVRPGVFYRDRKAFLHFHVDPAGLFADVRLDPDGDFDRVEVTTLAQRRELIGAVREALGSR